MFSLDKRSLALFRIGISFIIMLDLFVRSWHLNEFYTNNGVLPIPVVYHIQESSSYWSFHLLNGNYYFNFFLFILSFLFAFGMLIGWKTNLFTLLSWIMLTSLHNRNDLVLNGGDLFLRLSLFWSIFLPLGHRYSIDSIQYNINKSKYKQSFCSLITIAWFIQFASMYIFSFGLKYGITWWNGTAVSATLQQEQFLTQFGIWLRSILFPESFFLENPDVLYKTHLISSELGIWIMKVFCYITLYYELLGPYLLCVPIYTQYFRVIGVFGFIIMHISFGMCLEIGFFMYIPCIFVLTFLPSLFWNKLSYIYLYIIQKYIRLNDYIIYIDIKKENTLTKFLWNFFINILPFPKGIIFKYNQHPKEIKQILSEKHCFFIVGSSNTKNIINEGNIFYLFFLSPILLPISYFIYIIPFLRRYMISIITCITSTKSWNDFKYSETKTIIFISMFIVSCGEVLYRLFYKNKPQKRKLQTLRHIITTIIVLLTLLYCLSWNINVHYHNPQYESLLFISDYLRLDQWWGMFSPNPPLEYGWFVMPGKLVNGTIVDLLPGSKTKFKEPLHSRPKIISKQYPNQRWRKYLMNLTEDNRKVERLAFGQYLCRSWNWPTGKYKHELQLETFDILFYEINPVTPDFTIKQGNVQLIQVWSHTCF